MKHLKYMRYVLLHKWFVLVECAKYRDLALLWRGLVHDLSKFHRDEWVAYADYFYGDYPAQADIPSGPLAGLGIFPKSKEDVKEAFDYAWNRHQKRNDHHWQYWLLHRDDGTVEALPMPMDCILEMIADWKGAGRALGKPDAAAWYQANKSKIIFEKVTRYRVEGLLGLTKKQ